MELKDTKVLVATVTHEEKSYCQSDFIKQITSIPHPDYEILIVDNSESDENAEKIRKLLFDATKKKTFKRFDVQKDVWHFDARARIGTSYNKVREAFLKGDYTHLFVLESDVFPESFDFLEKWIKEDKPAITGMYKLYTLHKPPSKEEDPNWRWQYSVWYKRRILENNKLYQRWIEKDIVDNGIVELDYSVNGYGTGIVLLQRDVLYQIIFKSGFGTADSFLKTDLDTVGIKSYLDTDLKVEHKNRPWDEVIYKDLAKVKKLKRCGSVLLDLKEKKRGEKRIVDELF